jgi:hypothetical protein
MHSVIQSSDPDIDTLKCPKCKALWRAKGHYDSEGKWDYDYADICPQGCFNFFGFKIKGKRV